MIYRRIFRFVGRQTREAGPLTTCLPHYLYFFVHSAVRVAEMDDVYAVWQIRQVQGGSVGAVGRQYLWQMAHALPQGIVDAYVRAGAFVAGQVNSKGACG